MGNTDSRNIVNDRYIRLELDIQKEKMGKLIGTGGKTIQGIQQRAHNTTIRTPSKEDTEQRDNQFVTIILSGKATDAFNTSQLIANVVEICLAVLHVYVDVNHIQYLWRDSIKGLQKEIPIDTLRIPRKTDKHPRITLEGYLEDVIQGYQKILAEAEQAAKEHQDAKEREKLMAISMARLGDGAEGGEDDRRQQAAGKPKTPREYKERQPKSEEGAQVTEELVVPEASMPNFRKDRLSNMSKTTGTQIKFSDGRVKITGQPSNVSKAKRKMELLFKKLEQMATNPRPNKRKTKPLPEEGAAAGGKVTAQGDDAAGDAPTADKDDEQDDEDLDDEDLDDLESEGAGGDAFASKA
jgi:hypothetical protein